MSLGEVLSILNFYWSQRMSKLLSTSEDQILLCSGLCLCSFQAVFPLFLLPFLVSYIFFLFIEGINFCFRDAQYLYFFYCSTSQSNRIFASCFMTYFYWLNTTEDLFCTHRLLSIRRWSVTVLTDCVTVDLCIPAYSESYYYKVKQAFPYRSCF